MKLLFRPDKFIDKNGNEIELEDIEIEDVEVEGCTDCNCGYGWVSITFHRKTTPPEVFSTVTTENLNSIWDLQQEIEKTWNAGIDMGTQFFKTKNNLGRLDENSGVKLQLDLEGLKDMNKGLNTKQTVDLGIAIPHSNLHPTLNEIIDEDELNIPETTTYEKICSFLEAYHKQKDEILGKNK